jgi:hypothetical protein
MAGLYDQHRQTSFPHRLVADDANGVEMVSLDSSVSGCAHTWLNNSGLIDDPSWDALADGEQRLRHAIPALDADEASYFQRLLDMTVLILKSPNDIPPE